MMIKSIHTASKISTIDTKISAHTLAVDLKYPKIIFMSRKLRLMSFKKINLLKMIQISWSQLLSLKKFLIWYEYHIEGTG